MSGALCRHVFEGFIFRRAGVDLLPEQTLLHIDFPAVQLVSFTAQRQFRGFLSEKQYKTAAARHIRVVLFVDHRALHLSESGE